MKSVKSMKFGVRRPGLPRRSSAGTKTGRRFVQREPPSSASFRLRRAYGGTRRRAMPGARVHSVGSWLWAVGRPPTLHRQPPTANRQLFTANRQPPTANSSPPTAHRQQPTLHCQQPTANRQLFPPPTLPRSTRRPVFGIGDHGAEF